MLFENTSSDPCVDAVGPGCSWNIAAAVAAPIIGKVIGSVIGGGGSAAKGAVTAGPANPMLQSPVDYAVGQKAAYVAGRGFRKL